MRGFYVCENCQVYIEVYTEFKTSKGYKKATINMCPHCQSKNISETLKSVYNSIKTKLRIFVSRHYQYKHIGMRKIEMYIKFPEYN